MALIDDKINVIQWDVPVTQFQVDNQRLYRPRPPLFSPIATLSTDHLILQWQLSLEQGVDDAKVFVHHRTPNLPNQGVRYNVFALRTDGTTVRVTDDIRRALAKYQNIPSQTDYVSSIGADTDDDYAGCAGAAGIGLRRGFRRQMASVAPLFKSALGATRQQQLDHLVWNGETIKLRITIGWSNRDWDPCRILSQQIHIYNRQLNAPPIGLVGELLWTQVQILEQPDDPVPPNTDFLLVCPNGARIAAHRSVVAVYSEPFRKVAMAGPNRGPLVMHSTGLGTAALYEVLQFIYIRRLSPRLDLVPLNELLEASRIFRLPMTVRWEVEKVLTQILDESNRDRMRSLADTYNLKIIGNMVTKSYMDSDKLEQNVLSTDGVSQNNILAAQNAQKSMSLTESEANKLVVICEN